LTIDGAGDERAITVANESEQPLSGMRLITQDAIFRLPIDTLEPGETASLSMDAMSRIPLSNAGAAQGDALAGLSALGPVPWAEGREFDIRDALRRGAFVFYARNAGTAPCPLEIDGYRSHTAGERALLIVTYEEPPL